MMPVRKFFYDQVLGVIGILIFVDQDIIEFLLIFGQNVREITEQDIGLQLKSVEIHGIRLFATLLVLFVDFSQ